MKILVVTDNRFWREQLGSQRRISSLCTHFVARGHRLHVLFAGHLYPPDRQVLDRAPLPYALDAMGEREAATGPAVVKDSWPAMWRKRGKGAIKQLLCEVSRRMEAGHPSGKRRLDLQLQEPKLRDFVDPAVAARFRQACGKFQPDLVVIQYVRLAYLLSAGRNAIPPACRTLIDTHDVQYERQARFHERGEVHDIDISAAEEARMLSMADAVVAIQATDAAKLGAMLPGGRVIVAGFPETIHLHPKRDGLLGAVRLAFFGSDMPPNREAARALLDIHFPHLRQRFGDAVELHLFGRVCEAFDATRAGTGVVLHGFVDDLAAAYAEIDLIANPIAFGGGLKIKNVEALCHGRPLLTTPIGAEGLEEGIGQGFWVAKDEAQFSGLLEKLVEDAAARAALGEGALAFARCHLAEEAVYMELDSYIEG